ncbi:MAG TPA: hypothetical protein VIV58_02270 [Kofleriaceae bacterium]
MTSIRLTTVLLACAAFACDSEAPFETTSTGASDIATYQELASLVATEVATYNMSMMDAGTTSAMCAAIHDRYDQRVRTILQQMLALGGGMDGFMNAHGGAAAADVECTATGMMHELDAHAVVACTWTTLGDDRAEVARHRGAIMHYTDHVQQRCDEMMGGLDGAGWHWGDMMEGCSGGGMMGSH